MLFVSTLLVLFAAIKVDYVCIYILCLTRFFKLQPTYLSKEKYDPEGFWRVLGNVMWQGLLQTGTMSST